MNLLNGFYIIINELIFGVQPLIDYSYWVLLAVSLCAILGSNQLFLQNQWLPSWQSKKRLVKAGEIFGWKLILNFWLQAYSDPFLVHWSIYTRCLNCIKLTQSFSFRITHIYREGNACADKLAVLGSQGLGYTWWHSPPSFVSKEFFRYRQGLPFYRFL